MVDKHDPTTQLSVVRTSISMNTVLHKILRCKTRPPWLLWLLLVSSFMTTACIVVANPTHRSPVLRIYTIPCTQSLIPCGVHGMLSNKHCTRPGRLIPPPPNPQHRTVAEYVHGIDGLNGSSLRCRSTAAPARTPGVTVFRCSASWHSLQHTLRTC